MQTLTVFLIVVAAALYAAWRLMPRAWRGRLGVGAARLGHRRAPLSDADAAALARRLSAGGCGSCDSCGSCGTKTPAASEAPLQFVAQRPERAPH